MDGNGGSVEVDKAIKFAGTASCRLHKIEGPGGMMVQTEDTFAVDPTHKYRANCQLRLANATGAKAYWMISMLDAEGKMTADAPAPE